MTITTFQFHKQEEFFLVNQTRRVIGNAIDEATRKGSKTNK